MGNQGKLADWRTILHKVVGYQTGSGNKMLMTIHGHLVHRSDIPVVPDRQDVLSHCKHSGGCKGWNGGCPPYATHFDKMCRTSEWLYVITLSFNMMWAIKYSGWWKGVSAPGLYILCYADRLTVNYLHRMLNNFKANGHHVLGAGSCRGCGNRACAVADGKGCANPKKRMFSMEAVGVDCDALHQNLFGEPLPWWYRTPEHMPAMMHRYAGVFLQLSPTVDIGFVHREIKNELSVLLESDKSYCNVGDVPLPDGYFAENKGVEELVVPNGCANVGAMYNAYRIPVELMQRRK